jgi:putative transposase
LLGEVNSQSVKGMIKQVESAFTRFFREKSGFTKFKSKKNPIRSFPIPKHYNLDFENNTVKLPKIGEIKAVFHKIFEGKLKTATILKSCTRLYYPNILIDYEKEVPVK